MKWGKWVLASLVLISFNFLIIIFGRWEIYLSPFYIFKLISNAFYSAGTARQLLLYFGLYLFPILLALVYATELESKKKLKYLGLIIGADIVYKAILWLTVFSRYTFTFYREQIWVTPDLIGVVAGATGLFFVDKISDKKQYVIMSALFVIMAIFLFYLANRY